MRKGQVIKALIPIVILLAWVLASAPSVRGKEGSSSRFYARGTLYDWKVGSSITGVKGRIEVAHPGLRDPGALMSSASINIYRDVGGGGNPLRTYEGGWSRETVLNCDQKLFWATRYGPNPDDYSIEWIGPAQIGATYEFRFAQDQPNGYWSVTVWRVYSDGSKQQIFKRTDLSTLRWSSGEAVQCVGEVAETNIQDMGVSGLLRLKWRDTDAGWHGWHDRDISYEDPPYHIVRVPFDPGNARQVYGNNGNPGPYVCAP